jgi:glycosyltransferase involved in cell wall biosynthesis
MRIGVDIRTLMDREYSGVSWYTLDLLTEILRQGKQNEYILYYNSGHDVSGRLPLFKDGNVKIVSTRFPNKFFNYFLQKLCRWPKLDVIANHLAFPHSQGGTKGGLDIFWQPHLNFSSFSKGAKKILTIHDLSFLVYPEYFSWRKNIWHYLLDVRRLITAADIIIAISESTKRDLIRFFPQIENKIKVVYSGVGREFRKIAAANEKLLEIKKKYGLGEKFILSLGTAEPRKNAAGLIRAFDRADLSGWELVLVGASGWKNKAFHQALKAAKNKDKIKLLGYVDKDDRPYLYNAAKIFAYPSFYEGFGLPVLEAMACGTPVITSSVSSLPEITGDAALLVDPNNEEELVIVLQQLAISEQVRKAYSAKGLEQAKQFSWKKTAEEYFNIFY